MQILVRILIFLNIFLLGCTPWTVLNPIAIGVARWHDGEFVKYYEKEADILYRATKHALEELEYVLDRDEKNRNVFYIVAGENDKFKITIKEIKNNVSELKIRVNFMGNKQYAEMLMEKIDSNLNAIFYNDFGIPVMHEN